MRVSRVLSISSTAIWTVAAAAVLGTAPTAAQEAAGGGPKYGDMGDRQRRIC